MTYRFGAFEFDADALELRKSGRLMPLEPQPARALALLLSRANDVVTRDELKEAIWGADTHVDFDRGLAYCLSQVRAALGDKGDNPRFVQTQPRKGYSFIAPVRSTANAANTERTENTADTGSRETEVRRASRVGSRSTVWVAATLIAVLAAATVVWLALRRDGAGRVVIAVSVFDNETGEAQYDRLVAGLSDLVVTRLTQVAPQRIAVVGNAAVLRQPRNIRNLKAVAAGVKADYVVLGQLQPAETGLRFITHFIRLSDETHMQANRIPFPDGNVAGLEDKVVAEVERAVNQHVLRASSTEHATR